MLKVLVFISVVGLRLASLPEENLSVPDLIKYWNYPVENHRTVTEDGYILVLHRIPHGTPKNGYKHLSSPKPVVLLQHGLLCSSSNWVTNLPHQSLGFIMADAGYDVWMGNTRGNTYSNKHVNLETDSDKYWDFTFAEMAEYDLPSMVDYILQMTNQSQLYYVGHSQGTMIAFAGLSQNAKLRQQIKVLYALAPVAHLGNTESPIKYFTYVQSEIEIFFKMLGVRDFLPSQKWTRFLADKACPIDEAMCSNILFLMAGYDKRNLNETRIPVYFSHTPAGTSVKNMLHFSQLIRENQFQRYDYGYFGNIKTYGWVFPLIYNLKQITNPVVLVSGSNDWLANPIDVSWLSKELNHVLVNKKIDGYNHLDFIWGLDAREKVYNYILKSIKKYKYN